MDPRLPLRLAAAGVVLACLTSCTAKDQKSAQRPAVEGGASQVTAPTPKFVSLQANIWEFRTTEPDAARALLGRLGTSWQPAGGGTTGVISADRVLDLYHQLEELPGFTKVRSASLADVKPAGEWVRLDGTAPDKAGNVVPGHTILAAGSTAVAEKQRGSMGVEVFTVVAHWVLPDGTELRSGPTTIRPGLEQGRQNAIVLLAAPSPDAVQRMTILFASLGAASMNQTAEAPAESVEKLKQFYRSGSWNKKP